MGAPSGNRFVSPLKSWLAEFLLFRNLYKGPSGQPLYSYQVTAQEYEELRTFLATYRQHAFDYRHEHSWAACFCLYVAECFRREYDGGESGWAWSTFENQLGCGFSPQQHAELVTTGLEYWKRPIRQRERGRDLLGSLFAEGGLPWLLVQSDSHGFGRSVRKGLKDYYRARHGGRTTTDLIADSEQYLPQTFRNLETRQLLAGIVEQLMYLAERYPLREQSDPAAYLDKQSKVWRASFPIPLDEANAHGLINEWLKDAGRRRQERKEEEENARLFTCSHRLCGDLTDWYIQTEVIIPRNATFPLGDRRLSSTRMEICFYEGDRLLAKGGVVYGQLEEGQVAVRFPVTQVKLKRRAPQELLTMHLLENGKSVHIFRLAYSALECEDLPLIFEAQGDEWWFVSATSCAIGSGRARIRLPARFSLAGGTATELARDRQGGRWLETSESLQIRDASNLIAVKLNQQPDPMSRPELDGNFSPYCSTPATVYVGWPRLVLFNGGTTHDETLTIYANGNVVTAPRMRGRAGQIRYSVKNALGETVLQRRFGVLPEGFQLSLRPALLDRPARLQIRPSGLYVRVVDKDIHATSEISEEGIVIQLQAEGKDIPTTFTVEVSNDAADDPVLLHLPFPFQGARLIGPDGSPLEKKELTLDELAGVRIALTAGVQYEQRFTVHMELVSPAEQRLTRRYSVDVGNMPVMLNLFSYQNDMAQMLGAVNDQDAYIRLTLESEKRLLCLNVRRYNGQVRWLSNTGFEIVGGATANFRHGANAAAMLLADPRQASLAIPEKESEGVGTGVFLTVPAMERDSPWLIYPGKDSAVKFRPTLYVPAGQYHPASTEGVGAVKPVCSLHEAARVYHPQYQPRVIDEQVSAMASDLSHSGWQYLADLKTNFAHLPLSTFESWRALARHSDTLAVAVFRLEIDETFCGRIRDELAVIWECIPLPLWSATYRCFRDWLAQQALPDVLQQHLLENRKAVLPAVVSGFDHVGNYLESGDVSRLQKVPVQFILTEWYQALRRTHEANDHWPTDLGSVLSAWVQKQDLPAQIKRLSQITYSDAVTYLPIFMAYVTAGKAQLDDLRLNTAYLKFAIKMLSDFDRSTWYNCVHAMMVSYLLASDARG
jgi:hypothetical protein